MTRAHEYRPDIDGLRAVAVLPVVLYHAGLPALGGGFVGVDVFFVISGYLITRIIAEEVRRGEFSLIRFYERRARRILPALFVMMAFTTAMSGRILFPESLAAYGRSMIATGLFASNILFWKETGYFDAAAELKPLLHTWSLAVEEQFYIAFPLLLLGLWRARLPWGIVTAGLACLSLGLSAWMVRHNQAAAFYLPHMRAWELMIGSLLALGVFPRVGSGLVREWLAAGGLALIAIAVVSYTSTTPFPGATALVPCIGAALLIHAHATGRTQVGWWLSLAPVVFIGKISYSLYLWHWPLMVFAKYAAARELTGFETSAILALCFIAAAASWKWIESPFRTPAISRRTVFAGAGALTGLAVILGLAAHQLDGLPGRFPNLQRTIAGPEQWRQQVCFLGKDSLTEWKAENCYLTRGHATTTLLWGDSHAAQYAPGLMHHSDALATNILQYTASQCAPLFDYRAASFPHCEAFNAAVPDLIRRHNVSMVIMTAGWAPRLDGRESIFEELPKTVAALHALGVKVMVLGRTPTFWFKSPFQQLQTMGVTSIEPRDYATKAALPPNFNTRLAAAVGADFFYDPAKLLCQNGQCRFIANGKFLLFDPWHLSADGSILVVGDMLSTVQELPFRRPSTSIPGSPTASAQ